ncbi:MAG: hypothetical protein J1E02_09475 [Coprobacter sp.]|nr:hypothetical protein [Coprobacter sp.]
MTPTASYFSQLPADVQAAFEPVFGSAEMFYKTAYLIARNEHITSLDKAGNWEERVEVIHYYQDKLKQFLNRLSLDGENLMADIASDYFEDYVHYKDDIDFGMTNEDFLKIMRAIQQSL